MRILLTSPFAHPHVRRGTERYLHELGAWLAGRGHEVTILTTSPLPAHRSVEAGTDIHYVRVGRPFGRGRLRVDGPLRTAIPIARAALRESRWDIAQAHHYADGSALRGTRLGRPRPFVFFVPGVARRASMGGRPLHRAALRYACGGAARVHTLSTHAARALKDEFGLDSEVMPPGVRTELYAGARPPGAEQVILFPAAPEDPRKRADLVLRAFPAVLRARPRTQLVLAPQSPEVAQRLVGALDPAVGAHVSVEAGLDIPSLADLYRRSSVTVMASVDEAFGLVTVESLAAGTPVVGANHGGTAEVIRDPATGRLFTPDDADSLSRSLLDALELSEDPTTADRCRTAAAEWDWSVVGPRIEAVYASVAD